MTQAVLEADAASSRGMDLLRFATAGSVDSGLGGDFDESGLARGRSSSEEKDNLTPAQSRRKAQNRAAYAPSLCCSQAIADPSAASAPSVNARNVMCATSKPS